METTSCITFCVLEQGLNMWPRLALNSQSCFSFSRAAVTFLNNVYKVLSVLFDNKKYVYFFLIFLHSPSSSIPSPSFFLIMLILRKRFVHCNLRSWASQVPNNKRDAWTSLLSGCCVTSYIFF